MKTYCSCMGTFSTKDWSRVVVLSYSRMKARETLSEFQYELELEREYEKMACFLLRIPYESHSS